MQSTQVVCTYMYKINTYTDGTFHKNWMMKGSQTVYVCTVTDRALTAVCTA